MRIGLLLIPALLASLSVRAGLFSKTVEYKPGDTVLVLKLGRPLTRPLATLSPRLFLQKAAEAWGERHSSFQPQNCW